MCLSVTLHFLVVLAVLDFCWCSLGYLFPHVSASVPDISPSNYLLESSPAKLPINNKPNISNSPSWSDLPHSIYSITCLRGNNSPSSLVLKSFALLSKLVNDKSTVRNILVCFVKNTIPARTILTISCPLQILLLLSAIITFVNIENKPLTLIIVACESFWVLVQ